MHFYNEMHSDNNFYWTNGHRHSTVQFRSLLQIFFWLLRNRIDQLIPFSSFGGEFVSSLIEGIPGMATNVSEFDLHASITDGFVEQDQVPFVDHVFIIGFPPTIAPPVWHPLCDAPEADCIGFHFGGKMVIRQLTGWRTWNQYGCWDEIFHGRWLDERLESLLGFLLCCW